MNMKKLFVTIISILFAGTAYAEEQSTTESTKLYAMDCGTIDVSDMSDLSNGDEYKGQTIQLVNPCFLIRHPKGDLLWDTGHNDQLADNPAGEKSGVWHSKLKVKLMAQLSQIGLSNKDIEYLSLSHIHPDHSGNANQFSSSIFIVNELERNYMFSTEINGIFGELYSKLNNAKTIAFKDEYDVFNDGSVIIKSMPGHTPGSSVLLVRLKKSGNLLLTGDLYVHARGRQLNTMHKYNFDKKTTLDSRKQFELLAKKENARVVIQHEKQDFNVLPRFPEYLD